jgi:hypothetical protein
LLLSEGGASPVGEMGAFEYICDVVFAPDEAGEFSGFELFFENFLLKLPIMFLVEDACGRLCRL